MDRGAGRVRDPESTFRTEAQLRPTDGAPPDTSPGGIMQVRLVIEPPVAPLAARLATRADLDRISHCLDNGGRRDDFEGWDAKLHRAVAEAAHKRPAHEHVPRLLGRH